MDSVCSLGAIWFFFSPAYQDLACDCGGVVKNKRMNS